MMIDEWRSGGVKKTKLRRVRMYVDNGHAETKPGEARREAKA